jgi:hypothetical protein
MCCINRSVAKLRCFFAIIERMKAFFKPTGRKVIYASIFTLFPYVLAFILFGLSNAALGSLGFRAVVYWFPLLFLAQFLPDSVSTFTWAYGNNNIFLYYVYPLLSFSVWYLVSCTIAFFVKDRTRYHNINLVLIFCMCILYLYLLLLRR